MRHLDPAQAVAGLAFHLVKEQSFSYNVFDIKHHTAKMKTS